MTKRLKAAIIPNVPPQCGRAKNLENNIVQEQVRENIKLFSKELVKKQSAKIGKEEIPKYNSY